MGEALITILDGIGETSMPYNEFVRWRTSYCQTEIPVLIIISNKKYSHKDFPEQLRVICIDRNPFHIRKRIGALLSELNNNGVEYAIHLHQLKSATLSQLSMIGTGFRNKTVFTVHSTFSGYAFHNKVQSFFNGLMAKYVSCVSATSFERYPAFVKKIKGERIKVIRNGVDIDRINAFMAVPHRTRTDGNIWFIYVARIIPLKNHQFLLTVIRETDPRAHFLFVGQDSDGTIADKISEAGLKDRVKLIGLVPRETVFELLNDSDVYVSTSTLEGMPISVLEAMYCGLPSLLSEIPQHKEIGGREEFVSYLPFDKDKWIQEVNKYTEMDPNERRRRGSKAKQYAEANFSLQMMHEKYTQIYKLLRQC